MNNCKINLRLLSHFTSIHSHTAQRYFSVSFVNKNELYKLSYLNKQKLDERKVVSEESVKYPEILDVSREGKMQRKRGAWHNKIKLLGIVEEKIFELNMPRYYGWKINRIKEGIIPYDPLPKAQYVTRSFIVDNTSLPEYYNNILNKVTLDDYVKKIRSQVEDALVFEYYRNLEDKKFSLEMKNRYFKGDVMVKPLCEQIHRILISNLTPEYQYLLATQTDIEPRIEAFWFFGGLELAYEYRRGKNKDKTDPFNECIQYNGTPMLHLRHELPLNEIISFENAENDQMVIPVEPLDFRKTGYMKDRARATIIPGFWPGDLNEFGVLSYHNIEYLGQRLQEYNDHIEAIITQAIFGSFSWLYAQACYQGFSTFHDPTYPFINQMILTNGQFWCFSVYQLNTTTMHVDCINTNKRKNICWITEPVKLFDSIENGKVNGFNEEVLRNLIKFYANEPQAKKDINMKPYLRKEKLIANIEDPERRIWVEQQFKFLMSNRERHFLTPEIYHFQNIYIHKHKSLYRRYKKDSWQNKISPFNRRLDHHTPRYIPRCLRSSRKVKYAKTFYPSARKRKLALKPLRYKLC